MQVLLFTELKINVSSMQPLSDLFFYFTLRTQSQRNIRHFGVNKVRNNTINIHLPLMIFNQKALPGIPVRQ